MQEAGLLRVSRRSRIHRKHAGAHPIDPRVHIWTDHCQTHPLAADSALADASRRTSHVGTFREEHAPERSAWLESNGSTAVMRSCVVTLAGGYQGSEPWCGGVHQAAMMPAGTRSPVEARPLELGAYLRRWLRPDTMGLTEWYDDCVKHPSTLHEWAHVR